MPRKARQESNSGFLHVIVRGIGKQILFEDTSDYLYYLSVLQNNVKETLVKVCAYCLMGNHVHLLLFDPSHNSSLFMKKVGISYAQYYNKKYQHTGHVFQDRYKSEAIETEAYLLTAFRYILKNPEKAGICKADQYEWSSYACYGKADSFVDTGTFEELLGEAEEYQAFISVAEDDQCLEYTVVRMTDDDAKEIIDRMGLESGINIQSYGKEKRNEIIKKLLMEGLSIRQIERLTGISRGVIQRIKR